MGSLAKPKKVRLTPTRARVVEQDGVALEGRPGGHSVYARARQSWGLDNICRVSGFLRWGQVSKTDAVLRRHVDPVSGKEARDRQVVIDLRRAPPAEETVLDLA